MALCLLYLIRLLGFCLRFNEYTYPIPVLPEQGVDYERRGFSSAVLCFGKTTFKTNSVGLACFWGPVLLLWLS